MGEYKITLDRKTLEKRLKKLAKSPYKAEYTTCFAMCYDPGGFEVTYVNYECPICGKKTEHNNTCLYELNDAKNAVDKITKGEFSVDAVIDEHEYCSHCYGQKINYPSPLLKIRFSPDDNYHEVRTTNSYDYRCLVAFIKGMKEYEDDYDTHYPLVDNIDQIVKMTGLCPEIVEKWNNRWAVKRNKRKIQDAKNASAQFYYDLKSKYASGNDVLFTENQETLISYSVEIEDDTYIIPNSVTHIGFRAFVKCKNLKSIIIPDSVTHIDERAFKDCSNLLNITFSKNINYVGYSAFEGTSWLEAQPDGVVYIGNTVYTYKGDRAKITSLVLHEGITSISAYTFNGCVNLLDITFPNSLKSIGSFAFKNTAWLKAQPDGVVYIKNIAHTYKGNKEFTSLVFREGTKSIDEFAFDYSKKLESITLPDGLTHIGEEAFRGCKELKKFKLPYSVIYIGKAAFWDCIKLKKVKLSNSNTYVGEKAFGHSDSSETSIQERIKDIFMSILEEILKYK